MRYLGIEVDDALDIRIRPNLPIHQVFALAAIAQSRKRQVRSLPRKSAMHLFFCLNHFSDLPVRGAFKGCTIYFRIGRMTLTRPRFKRMQVQQRKPPPILPSPCIDVVNITKLRRLAQRHMSMDHRTYIADRLGILHSITIYGP